MSSYFPSPPSQPLILGHRGSPFLSFENTLPSYLSASLHADGVELDVFPLTDDTLVCYHGKGSDQECGIMNESHGLDLSIKTLDYEGLPRSVKKTFGDKACEIFEDEEGKGDSHSYIKRFFLILTTNSPSPLSPNPETRRSPSRIRPFKLPPHNRAKSILNRSPPNLSPLENLLPSPLHNRLLLPPRLPLKYKIFKPGCSRSVFI